MAAVRTQHEHHDGDGGNEREREQSADGLGTLRSERAWQPLLAESIQPRGQPRIGRGKRALHLVKHALLFHRQGHSATSGRTPVRRGRLPRPTTLPPILYQAFAGGKRKSVSGRPELRYKAG